MNLFEFFKHGTNFNSPVLPRPTNPVPVTLSKNTPPVPYTPPAVEIKKEKGRVDKPSSDPSIEVLEVKKLGLDLEVVDTLVSTKDLESSFDLGKMTQKSNNSGDVEESVASSSVSSNITLQPSFICQRCGNSKHSCHQFLFGTFLEQEIMHLYRKKSGDLPECEIDKVFDEKHNQKLQVYVYFEHEIFEEKEDFVPPKCLLEGGIERGKESC